MEGDKIMPEWLALKEILLPYWQELQNFRFSYLNPLFWVFWIAVSLVFSRSWGYRKAFSCFLVIAVILFANTAFENYAITQWRVSDPFLIRAIALLFAAVIFLYNLFIRI